MLRFFVNFKFYPILLCFETTFSVSFSLFLISDQITWWGTCQLTILLLVIPLHIVWSKATKFYLKLSENENSVSFSNRFSTITSCTISPYKIFASVNYNFSFHNLIFTFAKFFITSNFLTSKNFFLLPAFFYFHKLFLTLDFVFTSGNLFLFVFSVFTSSNFFLTSVRGTYQCYFLSLIYHTPRVFMPALFFHFGELFSFSQKKVLRDTPTTWLTFGCMQWNPMVYRCFIILLKRTDQLSLSK